MFSTSWPFARIIPAPSCSASRRRAKTPAPFATAFPAKCGKTSTASITRCRASIRRTKSPRARTAFATRSNLATHRFHGVTDATMPHDEGWQFLRIGWSLERAEMTARLVDVQYQNLLEEIPAVRRLRQSPVDGGAAVGGRVRSLSPPVSLVDRAGKSGRDADPASAASALDPLQHQRSAVGPARASAAPGPAPTPTKPNGWPGGLSSGSVTTKWAKFSSRGFTAIWANCFECAARSETTSPELTSTTRWWHESIPAGAHDGISLRRARFGKLQRGSPAARFTTKSRVAFRSGSPPLQVRAESAYRDAYGNWVHQFNVLPSIAA